MNKLIIVTGGAGFVGTNLIEYFLKKTNYRIISIDNYSSGSKKNHINNKRVRYIQDDTKNISIDLTFSKKYNNPFSFWRIFKNLSKFLK